MKFSSSRNKKGELNGVTYLTSHPKKCYFSNSLLKKYNAMNQEVYQFFTNDHHRIEQILEKAIIHPDAIDMELYNDFRIHLLTHIKMEEKIFFPAALQANNGVPLPLAAKLRLARKIHKKLA